jgi:hypothetical protein
MEQSTSTDISILNKYNEDFLYSYLHWTCNPDVDNKESLLPNRERVDLIARLLLFHQLWKKAFRITKLYLFFVFR